MTQEKNQHPNKDEQTPINQHSRLPASEPAVSADTVSARYSQNRPVQNNGFQPESHPQTLNGNASNGVGESPDLLRWRAESLLDEMMMGGADGSAAQSSAIHTSNSQNTTPSYSPANGQTQPNANEGFYEAGMADYGEGPAHDGRPPSEQPPLDYTSAGYRPKDYAPADYESAAPQSNYTNDPRQSLSVGGEEDASGPSEFNSTPENGADSSTPSPVYSGNASNYAAVADEQNDPSSLDQQVGPRMGSAPSADPAIINQPSYNQNPPAQFPPNQHSALSNPQGQNVQNPVGPHQHAPNESSFEQNAYEQNTYNQDVPAQNTNVSAQDAYDQNALGQPSVGLHPSEQRSPTSGNLRQPTAAHLTSPSSARMPAMGGGQVPPPPSPAYQEPADGTWGQPVEGNAPQNHQAPAGNLTPGNAPHSQPPQAQPLMGQSPATQPAEWANRPSFEQGYSPQPNSGPSNSAHQNVDYSRDYPQRGYPDMGSQPMGQNRGPQERNQQPLDPATYYAQQIAWRRELERKQWAISSGSSSDYLTSVPRYEEAQNRTASYMDRMGGQASWQQNDGYNARYPGDGYAPNGHGQNPSAYSQGGIHANPNYSPQLGPVNPGYGHNPGYDGGQQPRNMPFAERMDVGAQAQRHSNNLLPRRSQISIDALYEEMTVLQAQVDAALPIYGDSADRALHLLEKGRSILEQNPERSAEVSYYVQQVSGIIQRGQQRIEWSNLYRDRLSRYLSAWLFMGFLGIIGSLAYGDTVAGALSSLFPALTGFFTTHVPSVLLTLAASIIGTSGAALANMWRHSQKEYGFFDRKYGLLGVVLPLMGLVVGLVIYAVMAILYLFLNVSPDTNWLAHILPALFALIYGSSQEKIYGTSD